VTLRNCVVASFLWDSSDLACTRRGFLLFSSAFRRWIAVKNFFGRGSESGFWHFESRKLFKDAPGGGGGGRLGSGMGIFISKLFASLFGDREARILVLGLDNAGKTTILCIRVLALLAFTCLVGAGVLFVCLSICLVGWFLVVSVVALR